MQNQVENQITISLIVTVFNEGNTINKLLESLQQQTTHANEIIITDAGSSDGTQEKITAYASMHPELHITLIEAKGNRSYGRNVAIEAAKYSWIAITDAGCVADRDWLEELVAEQSRTGCGLIAGYYRGLPVSSFQEAVVPYVLVMPENVNPLTFRPATRSMLMHASIWNALGGFDQRLEVSEDYDFAIRAEKLAATHPTNKLFQRSFTRDAVVSWMPRQDIVSFFSMVMGMAAGDAEGDHVRTKVLLVYARYILVFLFFVLWLNTGLSIIGFLFLIFVAAVGYSFWAVQKNAVYAPNGWYWLPVLQFCADFGVMIGTIEGLMDRRERKQLSS